MAQCNQLLMQKQVFPVQPTANAKVAFPVQPTANSEAVFPVHFNPSVSYKSAL